MYSYAPTSVSDPCRTPCVVALGCFDGLHIGHQALLQSAAEEAKQLGLPLVVYSPEAKKGQALLFTPEEKTKKLYEIGCDRVILADFDSIKDMSAKEFIDDILCDLLDCRVAVCGFNFTFGHRASGDSQLLWQEMEKKHRTVRICPPVLVEDAPVSSTRIRGLLLDGKSEAAAQLLGRPYTLHSSVTHGRAIGRSIGFPTLNLEFPEQKLIPHTGVYYVRVHTPCGIYAAVANIGVRPTFADRLERPVLEAHLLGFTGDLYEKDVMVEICTFLREEKTFADSTALAEAIQKDLQNCLALASSDPILTKESL